MHTKDARKAGERELRLYALAALGGTPFFKERERAALALTDAITLVTRLLPAMMTLGPSDGSIADHGYCGQ
jgi:alkylhydroperoxidase family enzyme